MRQISPLRAWYLSPPGEDRKAPQVWEAGFSLMELLITIAVISIFVGLTVGAISTSRKIAQQTQNATKLRSLGLATLAYAADHNGKLPATSYDNAGEQLRYTCGAEVNMHAAPRRLLSTQWPGGRGDTDYLASPDAFYGPFTSLLNQARKQGQFYQTDLSGAGVFRIGYIFYSLLMETDGSGRAPFGNNLANDRLGKGSLRTPLYSDMIPDWTTTTGYNGDKISVVYIDGSINVFPRARIEKASGATERIRIMAGVIQ